MARLGRAARGASDRVLNGEIPLRAQYTRSPASRGTRPGFIVTRCSNFALWGFNKQATIPHSSSAGTSLIQIAFSRAGGIKLDRQLSAKLRPNIEVSLPANSASGRHRLLGDIGATNVRFALLSNGVLGPIKWFTVADFPRFTDAVNAFLDCYCRQVSVCEALLAVAGPIDNDRCVLTNSAWTIDAPELCAAFSFAKVHILNDFEAMPYHYRSSRQQICIQWEVVRPYWELQWRCWDLGPASASPALCRVLKAPLLSQAKAVTRLWQLSQTAKMRSSTICAGNSVTYRRSE